MPASLLLAVTAIIQALGIYRYADDPMMFSGQIFFPVLFALMAIYISWRNREAESKFPLAHIIVLALAVVALAATVTGMTATLYYFYPSLYVYYAAFGLLVLELGLRIAAMPKKERAEKPARTAKKTRGTNLVAVKKTDSAQKAD